MQLISQSSDLYIQEKSLNAAVRIYELSSHLFNDHWKLMEQKYKTVFLSDFASAEVLRMRRTTR